MERRPLDKRNEQALKKISKKWAPHKAGERNWSELSKNKDPKVLLDCSLYKAFAVGCLPSKAKYRETFVIANHWSKPNVIFETISYLETAALSKCISL